jgi:Rrf2 family iron-sulfur cluster assembly transcriptional regulator
VGEVLRLTDAGLYAVAKQDPAVAGKVLMADEAMSRMLWQQLQEHITTFMEKVTIADLCSETRSNNCPTCTCPEYVQEVQAHMQNGKQKGCATLLS